MKIKQNNKAITIGLVLLLALSAAIAVVPFVDAHSPAWNIDTWTYNVVSPDPAGVGQTVFVVFWLNAVPPTATGQYGDRWTFNVKVTKPDGTQQTLGPITSDPVGNGYTAFTPDKIGNYTFQTSFPGYTITNKNPQPGGSTGLAYVGDYYKPSTSATATLRVQQEPAKDYPGDQLPDDYWNRPIEGENREWWTISGNWFAPNGYNQSQGYYYKGGGFNPYTTGPGSAHIVWKQPLQMFGGIMGGELSTDGGVGSYYNGMSYEQAFAPPVIMQGRLYYTTPPGAKPNYGTNCIDLRTGEKYWWQNISITYGQIYNYISPNQFGGIPYLWSTGSTYKLYDAYTGNWILDLANATSGGTVDFAKDGSMLVYFFNGARGWLAMWNSSLAIWANMPNLMQSNNYWLWRPPQGAIVDWRKGIQWNMTFPSVSGNPSIFRVNSEVVICRAKRTVDPGNVIAQDMGFSVVPGQTPKLAWGPINRTAQPSLAFGSTPMADGIYTDYIGETMSWYGYSVYTGQQLWGPSRSTTNAFAMYGAFRTLFAAYGKIYQIGMDGCVHAMDLQTGKWLWTFNTGSSGTETNYGQWPLLSGGFFGGAPGTGGLKIYAVGGHTHLQPLFRGAELYAIDGETGKLLWSILGWWQAGAPVAADGYMAAVNGYDNQLYCFGKGQTETTVTAPETIIPRGTQVLIQGTVTDQSPAQKGTPAISDASMSDWMEYTNMQKPKPNNATGVPVVITAIDPNGNFQSIGTATSDDSGLFKMLWTPPVEGAYTIKATFEGSESYWQSSAETAIGVGPSSPSPSVQPTAPPSTTSPTATAPTTPSPSPSPSIAPPPTTAAPTITYTAIGAAIAVIVIVAAAIILRKRK